MVLLENPNDPEYYYIGVGVKEGNNDKSTSNPILFKELVTILKILKNIYLLRNYLV